MGTKTVYPVVLCGGLAIMAGLILALVWVLSHRPLATVESEHVSGMYPKRDCAEFHGQPKKFAGCYGYE